MLRRKQKRRRRKKKTPSTSLRQSNRFFAFFSSLWNNAGIFMVICKANLSRRLGEQLKLIFSARRSLGRWILMETFFPFFFVFLPPPFANTWNNNEAKLSEFNARSNARRYTNTRTFQFSQLSGRWSLNIDNRITSIYDLFQARLITRWNLFIHSPDKNIRFV